jgi:hypothetical protein
VGFFFARAPMRASTAGGKFPTDRLGRNKKMHGRSMKKLTGFGKELAASG